MHEKLFSLEHDYLFRKPSDGYKVLVGSNSSIAEGERIIVNSPQIELTYILDLLWERGIDVVKVT